MKPSNPVLLALWAIAIPVFAVSCSGRKALAGSILFSLGSMVPVTVWLVSRSPLEVERFLVVVVISAPFALGLGLAGYFTRPFEQRNNGEKFPGVKTGSSWETYIDLIGVVDEQGRFCMQ